GYGLEMLSAKEEKGAFVIDYLEIIPQGIVTQALTTPYLIKILPKTDLEVKFRRWNHVFLYLADELDKRNVKGAYTSALREAIIYKRGPERPEISQDIKEDAVSALIEALKVQDKGIRENAAWALGLVGPKAKNAVPHLIRMANDKDRQIRLMAIWSLGEIRSNTKEAAAALTRSAKSGDEEIRLESERALGKIQKSE
ncbi:MAG: HEAT repeat domain-containing protein, partial [Candidatus Omnitrophota bacterium]|nr:HEAT repeat domain-containing protein [Candidatus Omnitrophota bacterium]